MHCTNCGTPAEAGATFCANCGAALNPSSAGSATIDLPPAAPAWQAPGGTNPALITYPPQVEERGRRVIAYLIDLVPMILLALVHFLPVVGSMFYGLIHICYWLFRDYTGSSLGKMALGAYVTNEDGGPSTTQQRIMRNLPLAIPGIIGLIPLIGIIFHLILGLIIFGGEAILLLATGRRMGDRIAGTNVYRKGVSL